jgi:hypothetical protein
MKPGQKVYHEVYGEGVVISVEDAPKMGDNNTWDRQNQSSIIRQTNGLSRYSGHLNIGVRFINGGPQGFAVNASNEANELKEI